MNKLIIVEGPQGVGKTTVTNWLRERMTYSNLYRMTGHNDKSPSGLLKSITMYDALMYYIYQLQCTGVNLIFDRIFISEEAYCRLEYRDYSFTRPFTRYTEQLQTMTQFDKHIINLQCMDTNELARRLVRDKKQHLGVKFDVEESLRQQSVYAKMLGEMANHDIRVHSIPTDYGEDHWKESLIRLLGI